MATRTATQLQMPPTMDYTGILVVQWTGLTKTTDDVGDAVELPNFADRSVQVVGTFGSGGSVRIEGSLLAAPSAITDYAPLSDPNGNALDVTTSKIEAISEAVRWIRPRVTAGDGSTSLTVYIFFRKG